ncbi:MAG: hypothetical protein ACK4P3_04095 [Fimbriimonadaceae bacterium]
MKNSKFALGFLFAVGIVAGGVAQDLDQKVNLDLPGVSARNLMSILSQQTGINFESSTFTENDVLVVRVKDMPLDQLLVRISNVTGAEWEPIGGGFRMIRTTQRNRDLMEQESQQRGERLRPAIEAAAQRIKVDFTDAEIDEYVRREREARQALRQQFEAIVYRTRGEGQAQGEAQGQPGAPLIFQALGGQISTAFGQRPYDPAMMAMRTALETLDVSRLGMIQHGERVVFANNPTPRQRQAPFDVGATSSKFVSANNRIVDLVGIDPNQNDQAWIGFLSQQNTPQRITGGIRKVMLIATRESADEIRLLIRFYDNEGALRGESAPVTIRTNSATPPARAAVAGSSGLPFTGIQQEFMKIMADRERGSQLPGFVESAVVSNVGGTRLATAFTQIAGAKTFPMSEELLTYLSNPATNEPLGLIAGPALLQASQLRDKNVVASLPDSLFSSAPALAASTSADGILKAMDALGLEAKEVEGTWEIAPTYLYSTAIERFNRRALQQLFSSIGKKKFMNLADASAYASTVSNAARLTEADMELLGMVYPNSSSYYRFLALSSFPMLQVFHTLTPQQRQLIAQGGTAVLNPQQRQIAEGGVFGASGGSPFGQVFGRMGRVARGGGPAAMMTSLQDEITEMLPNGLPQGASVGATTSPSDGVFGMADISRDGRFLRAGELGATRQFGNLIGGGMDDFSKFQLANLEIIVLNLLLNDNVITSGFLQDQWIAPNSRVMSFDELPESMRAGPRMQMPGGGVRAAPPQRRTGPGPGQGQGSTGP